MSFGNNNGRWREVTSDEAVFAGVPTGSFTGVQVEWSNGVGGSWVTTTPVPDGSQCRIRVFFTANSGGGVSWSVCVTCIDNYDGAIKLYGMSSKGSWLGIGGSVNIAPAGGVLLDSFPSTQQFIMPAHDLQLSLHLFASFDATPSTSLLDNGDPSMYY